MKIQVILWAAFAACATTFGALAAQSQVNNQFHPAIVVPFACSPAGSASWTVVDGHHVLALSEDPKLGSNAGFELFGNVQSVEHGVIPSDPADPARSGPIEKGVFTFQVYSHGADATPGQLLSYHIESNTGANYSLAGPYETGSVPITGGLAHIPITAPPAGLGSQPAKVYVSLGGTSRAVVGNFRLNGTVLDGTTLHDPTACAD